MQRGIHAHKEMGIDIDRPGDCISQTHQVINGGASLNKEGKAETVWSGLLVGGCVYEERYICASLNEEGTAETVWVRSG